MSTELATTQPVRRPGSPAPIGGPLPPDKLGLTLRERLWLTRAALATIVLSLIASGVILCFVPAEVKSRLPDAIADRLQRDADLPAAPVHVAPIVEPELPAAEVHRAVEPAAPPPPATAEAQPPVKPEAQKAAPVHRVQILRNTKSKEVGTWPVVEEAARVDVPQPLSPQKVEDIERPAEKPVEKPAPAPDEDGLKRPAFE